MKLLKPKKLSKGDVIGIISPASTPNDLTRIQKGVKYLESLGYRTEVGKNVGKYYGYLAGRDEERIEDIHYMFGKREIRAIFCLRGGYGTPRLLDKLDYNLIKKHPKIFVGYSDITALQMAFFKKARLVSFAGPMVAVDFHSEERSKYTEELFWRLVTSDKKGGHIEFPNNEKLEVIRKGSAKGKILGGNLALLTSMMGTEYFPDLKDKVLMLEDTGEAPYRLDRMLNQLKLAGILKNANGVMLGAFTECVEKDPETKTLTLGEIIEHYFCNLKAPIVYNFQHGHIKDNITIPWGIEVHFNALKNTLEYLESAVV
ncbi:MAG TPA: LD-carboxypeptidase [Ignavibacteriaceae bacterium]|nr:LD-carboxypeptidase [Ignavibacteriaceae bacterium]